jgi:hypothetical protein
MRAKAARDAWVGGLNATGALAASVTVGKSGWIRASARSTIDTVWATRRPATTRW